MNEERRSEPPEGTARWKPDLSREEQAHVEQIRGKIEPVVRCMQQIRTALGMSESDFLALLQKDEHEGLPPSVPRASLTISKLMDAVKQQGGTLGIIITTSAGQIFSIA